MAARPISASSNLGLIKNQCCYDSQYVHSLLEKYPAFFFAKTWWISIKPACMRDLEPSYTCVNFFLHVNSVSWWQAIFGWGSVQCSLRIFIVRIMTGSGSYPYTENSSPVVMVFMKSGSLFMESSMSWMYGYNPETKSFRHFKPFSMGRLGNRPCDIH